MNKVLSLDVVKTVANFLLLTFGKTTTLDVKSNLRLLGFEATQEEVSNLMDEYYDTYNVNLEVFNLGDSEVELVYDIEEIDGKQFRMYSFFEISPEVDYDDNYNFDLDSNYCDGCGEDLDDCLCDYFDVNDGVEDVVVATAKPTLVKLNKIKVR
jgi:hypothetical protein